MTKEEEGVVIVTPQDSTLNPSWVEIISDSVATTGNSVEFQEVISLEQVDVLTPKTIAIVGMINQLHYHQQGFAMEEICDFVAMRQIAGLSEKTVVITPSEITIGRVKQLFQSGVKDVLAGYELLNVENIVSALK